MTDSIRDRIDRVIYDVWNSEKGDEIPYLSPEAREAVVDALLAAFPWLANEPRQGPPGASSGSDAARAREAAKRVCGKCARELARGARRRRPMSAAEREAERRFPLWLPTGDYEIDREDYSELDATWQNEDTERDRARFVEGAEWQADHDHMLDAVRALVEQQRIANLIALATLTDVDTDGDILRADAMDRLVQWVPHGPDDEHPEVRPEIAAALGIKTKETNE